MNLYFQFLTQDQSVDAVEILGLIPVLIGDPALRGRVRVSAQASVSRSTFSDMEALSSRLASRRFNELEVLPRPLPRQFASVKVCVQSINSVFYPSPTSALWLPTKDWQIDAERPSRNKYMTAQSTENVLKFYGVTKQPSVLVVAATIATKSSQDTALNDCAGWLARTLPGRFGKLRLFGCCDAGGPELGVVFGAGLPSTDRVRIMARTKPLEFAKLGGRFEALHPLMFGSKRLCEGISRALGNEVKLITANDAGDFAVVRLAPDCDKESARSQAAVWLLNGTR